MPNDYILLYTSGGAPVQLPAVPTSQSGVYTIGGIIASGLTSTTAGVTDSVDKRFVTDAELTALEQVTGQLTESLLATVTGVDLNTATPSTLYTVPAGKTCIITKMIFSAPSTSLTTAAWSVGFNSAAFNDVLANATHTELTGATLYTILFPKVGAKMGAAADVLKLLTNVLQGGAATVTVRVFGMLY